MFVSKAIEFMVIYGNLTDFNGDFNGDSMVILMDVNGMLMGFSLWSFVTVCY